MKAIGCLKPDIINISFLNCFSDSGFRFRQFIWILFVALEFISCRNDMSEIRSTMAFFEPRKEWGKNIEMVYSEDGMVRIRLQAPLVNRLSIQDPYVEFPDGVGILFYDDNLKVNSRLTAKYGIRYENRGQTIFRDSVKIVNTKNEICYTDELIWDETKQKIYSDKFVKVVTPDEHIIGRGFEANQDFSNYKVFNITNSEIRFETDQVDEGF